MLQTKPGNHPGGPRQRGVTLMELMIALVILAILVSVAYPTYQEQVQKTRRSEAMIALVEMANLEEQFFADNFRYTATVASLPYIAATPLYTLDIPTVTTNPPGFTVRARAPSGSSQYADTNCRELTLTNAGTRASKNSGGSASTGCWVTGE